MARGRMLNRSICTNEEIDAIITKLGFRAGLFVTWMIPFLDVEGRMTGNPAAVRAHVAPLRIENFPVELVEKIIKEAHDQGVLKRYTVGEKKYIWFPSFDENQIGLRKEREGPSRIPPPPTDGVAPESIRSSSGPAPDLVPQNRSRSQSEEESQENESSGADGALPPADPDSPLAHAEKARRDFMPEASAQTVAALVKECPAVDVAENIQLALEWTKKDAKRRPKNWSSYLRKWIRRADGRPEGGKSKGEPKPNNPTPKPEPSREDKEAANEKLMREQRERLGL